ncbi:MAG: hypothetical protein KC636_37755, partial [Myxococcales bacterium]|nr:hypothetical protein [Myxococcales bacterium]
ELDARASVYLQGQPAARALERLGCELVVDLGERPAVAGVALISACAGADGDVGLALAHALAQLYNRGVDLCWEQICAPLSPRRVRAPTYPFTRRRHWIDRPREPAASAVIDLLQQGDYATLARRIEAEGRLSPGERALLPGVLSALGAVMSGSSTTQEEASVSVQVHQPAKRRPPASPHPTHQPCLEGHEKKPAASRADAAARVRASLVSRVAELLGLDGPVDLERGLFDLGLDSLMISELHEHLRSDLGLEVPLTTFLERPTLTSLSEHLAGVLVGDEPARPARAEPSEPAYDQLSEDEAIAVIARKYTTER